MLGFLGSFVDRVCVLSGAVICAQAPQYYFAYTQRLAGHVAELQLQLGHLRKLASRANLDWAHYVAKFVQHTDPDIAGQGQFMIALNERHETLTHAYQAMQEAGSFSRPFAFLRHAQWDVARATLQDFQFGLTFTAETAIYALVGMGLGYGLFRLLCTVLSLPRRWMGGAPKQSAESQQ